MRQSRAYRQSRHTASILALLVLLSFVFTSISFAEKPYRLLFSVSIANSGNPVAPVTRDTPVTLTFRLSFEDHLAQHQEAILDETFYIYLLRGFFAGSEATPIFNPLCSSIEEDPYGGERVFALDQLEREPGRDAIFDEQEYICYSLRLNSSPGAKAYFSQEAPASVAFSFSKLLAGSVQPGPDQVAAIVTDAGGARLGSGAVTIESEAESEQQQLPSDALLTVSLSIQERYLWDSSYTAGGAAEAAAGESASGAYLQSAQTEQLSAEDIAVFRIEISNLSNESIGILSITEHLPEGYRVPAWPEARAVVRGGETQLIAGSDQLLPPQSAAWQSSNEHNTYLLPLGGLLLQPGERYTCYFAAEAWQQANLMNIVSVQQQNGLQATGTYEPASSGTYDLALTTKIVSVYNSQNEWTADASGVRPVPVTPGGRLGVRFRVENQGAEPAGEVSLVAYVPAGLSPADESDFPENTGWAAGKSLPADDAGGVWSELTLHHLALGGAPLQPGEAREAALFLTVGGAIGESKPDGYPEDVWLPTDFYIAGEIENFLDSSGRAAVDADSTADSDPTNDLMDNRAGIHRLSPINLYQKWQEGSYAGEVKEQPENTADRAKLRTGMLQDEDDFDFDYAAPQRAVIAQPQFGKLAHISRLPAEQADAGALAALFGENAAAYITGAAAQGGLSLSPAGDDGVLRTMQSYALYEVWLNRDGLADTSPSTLTVTLPEGLHLLPYTRGEAGSYDLARLFKYEPLQRVPAAENPQRQIIYYADGFVAERPLYFAGGTVGLRDSYLAQDGFSFAQNARASAFGVKAAISADRRTLELTFESPAGSEQQHTDTTGAYRLLLLAAVDSANTRFQPMRAALSYRAGYASTEAIEESPFTWESGARPFLSLSAWHSQLERYVEQPMFSIAMPDETGAFPVRYRLRVASELALPAGSLRLAGELPEELFYSFGGDPLVQAYADPQFDDNGDPVGSPREEEAPVSMLLDAEACGVVATNPRATNAGEYYDITYQVNYSGVRYGQLFTASVAGASLQSVAPLCIQLSAKDLRSGAALAGVSYDMYYADGSGQADLSRPVRDIDGKPVQVFSAGASAYFLPEGYAPGFESTWQAVLLLSSAPESYAAAAQSAVPLAIHADADGMLHLNSEKKSFYSVTTNQSGVTQINAYFTAPAPISLYALDAETHLPLAGAGFLLHRPNGRVEQLPMTDRAGRVSFLPDAPQAGSYSGTYLLQPNASPDSYAFAGRGDITLTLGIDGSVKSIDAGPASASSANAYAAFKNNDGVSLSVLFSPITRPTLLAADSMTGTPISGAKFSFSGPGARSFSHLVETDSSGGITLPLPEQGYAGEYVLQCLGTPEGYSASTAPLRFTITEAYTLQLAAGTPGAAVAGGGYCLRLQIAPGPAPHAANAALPSPTPSLPLGGGLSGEAHAREASAADTSPSREATLSKKARLQSNAPPYTAGSTGYFDLAPGQTSLAGGRMFLLCVLVLALLSEALLVLISLFRIRKKDGGNKFSDSFE